MSSGKNDKFPIGEIKVENRRREDYGDIEGLAESIGKYGLFHPIIVDDKRRLIAGERRLRACKQLGWPDIPVRLYRHLTDDERREIELEENLQRKDLTPYERSRELVKLAETAAKVDKRESETMPNVGRVSKRGPRPLPGSEVRAAERIGVPRQTIQVAKQHVAAVEEFPELAAIPTQKDALTIAKNLRNLPEEKKTEARQKLAANDSETLTTLAEKPPMREREHAPGESPGEKWNKSLYRVSQIITSVGMNGGVVKLARAWRPQERAAYYETICGFVAELGQWKEALEEVMENDERAAREDVA